MDPSPSAKPELDPARRAPADHAPSTAAKNARRLGIGVFLFFLGKGLLWLIGPALLAWWATR